MNSKSINQDLFEKYPIPKAVWTLALPTMASMIVTLLYNLADTYFVGQTNDPIQVAAVSLAVPVFMFLMAIGNLFGVGASAAISRSLGGKKTDVVKHISSFSVYTATALGVLSCILMLVCMDAIVPLIGASADTYAYVESYVTYLAFGAPFIILNVFFGNIVRSTGQSKQAMMGMMIGTIVNIVLDPIMIIAMDMGVIGAAVATVIGNVCGVVYYLVLLLRTHSVLSLSLKDYTLEKSIVTDVLKIGIPSSLSTLLLSVGTIVCNSFLNVYGDVAIASMGIAIKANLVVVMVFMGITMGAQPLIGYSYGAGHHDRMKGIIKYLMAVVVCAGVVMGVLMGLNAETIVGVFIEDAEVVSLGGRMLVAHVASAGVLGLMFVSSVTLQSMGKGVFALILAISRQGLAFIPLLFLTDALWGLDGIMWAQAMADVVAVIFGVTLVLISVKQIKGHNPGTSVPLEKP